MSDQLMRYYERELANVRKSLSGFAQRFPEQAAQLQLNQNGVEDPNISRLIDGMALLTAKTEQRLDEQMPEIVQDLFSLLYPGYLQIIPSYSPLMLEPDPEQLNENVVLPAGSELSIPVPGGDECTFRTASELAIYPFVVDSVHAEAAPFNFPVPRELKHAESVIQITLKCCDPEALFSQLQIQDFDFYVRGFEQKAGSLIELLLQQTELVSVMGASGDQQYAVSSERLMSRVADPSFQWLPRYGNQFAGFEMLRDYFAYPDKGAYFRLHNLGQEMMRIEDNTLVLNLFVRSLPAEFMRMFDASVFCLNTVPAINCFEQKGEPLSYDYSRLSVPVEATAYSGSDIEVISVEEVREVLPDGERVLRPLYEVRYGQDKSVAQWQSRQRWDEKGMRHLSLSLGMSSGSQASSMVLAMDLQCCNGRTPCLIPAGARAESLAQIDLPGELSLLTSPSAPQYPALDNDLNWRFIALLNGNFSTLMQTETPVRALQDILSLCNHGSICLQAESVRDVAYVQQVAPMNISNQNIYASGTQVTITLDSETLGGQVALFGEVLNGFYQQFCSFDRFMQINIRYFGSDTAVREYPRVHGSQLCL